MDVLLQSLTQHAASVAVALIVTVAFLFAATAALWIRQRRYEAKWRSLLSDTRGESLETLLYDHLRERMRLEQRLTGLEATIDDVGQRMTTAKRFVGLVRYDAFPDVAGSQSFALAFYDERGDGAILSSIVGRSTCRVYCKPLVAGRSERDLSQEEQRAIREAKEAGLKPILSP